MSSFNKQFDHFPRSESRMFSTRNAWYTCDSMFYAAPKSHRKVCHHSPTCMTFLIKDLHDVIIKMQEMM